MDLTGAGVRAGILRRTGAWILDAVILGVVLLPLYLPLALVEPVSSALALVCVVAAILGALVYYVLTEGGLRAATPGKRLLALRVVRRSDLSPIGRRRAALRYLARFLSAIPLLAGYWWCLADPERRTWHDRLTESRVIQHR